MSVSKYQWPTEDADVLSILHITICRTNDSALVSLRRTSDKTRSERYLGFEWEVTPTFTFAGVNLRVAGDQVIWPVEVVVMSPHQGNVTSLITLSPPPLCSQFPIIHLIRWWRQGDTSHRGSCITNPTNPMKNISLLGNISALFYYQASSDLILVSFYWLQLPILNWWVWAAPALNSCEWGRL